MEKSLIVSTVSRRPKVVITQQHSGRVVFNQFPETFLTQIAIAMARSQTQEYKPGGSLRIPYFPTQ
jgi:hypothetical protein